MCTSLYNIISQTLQREMCVLGFLMCESVLLGNFDLDVDVVIAVSIATDPRDAFTRKTDPMVGLGSRWDL